MTLRYAWFGKLAFVAICLIVAVCLGSGVSVAKKKPKAKVISEGKAKLVLQVPGLVNAQAARKPQATRRRSDSGDRHQARGRALG